MAIDFGPDHRAGSPQVIVGGGFTHIDGIEANGVAIWDGTQWSALGGGVGTAQTPVLAVAWGDSYIYASSAASGSAEILNPVLTRWDGTSWEELGVPARGLPAPLPGTTHQFVELSALGDHVVAAGSVWPITYERNVYIFDGESFTSLGGGLGAGYVDTHVVTPDALWFGGSIATFGTDDDMGPSVGIARYTLSP